MPFPDCCEAQGETYGSIGLSYRATEIHFSLFMREFSCSAYLPPFSFFSPNSKAICESDPAGKESRKREGEVKKMDAEMEE